MTPVSENVMKAIQSELPTLAANELSAYLQQAQKNEADLETMKKGFVDVNLRLNEANTVIRKFEKLGQDEAAVTAREVAVSKRENFSDVAEAKYKLEEAGKRNADLMRLIEVAFKSPVYRSTYYDSGMSNGMSTNRNGNSETRVEIQ